MKKQNPQNQPSDLMKAYRSADPQKRQSMMRSIVGANRYEFIGDFLIVDAAVMKKKGTSIMHMPSGRFRNSDMPIEESIKAAKSMTPYQIADTVQWIYEC